MAHRREEGRGGRVERQTGPGHAQICTTDSLVGRRRECMWTCIPKDTGRENKLEKKYCSSLRSMPVSSSAGSIFRHEMSLSRSQLFMPLLYIFLGGGGWRRVGWDRQKQCGRRKDAAGVKWHHCLALEAKDQFAKIKEGFHLFNNENQLLQRFFLSQ